MIHFKAATERMTEETRGVVEQALRVALSSGSNYIRPQDLAEALRRNEAS